MATKTVTLEPEQSKEVAFSFTPAKAKVYIVRVDGLTDSFAAVAPPTLFGGYDWCYSEFLTPISAPASYICNDSINKLNPNPAIELLIDPSKDEVAKAISDPNNTFYHHSTHGLAGLFLTYGQKTQYVYCHEIRKWIKDRDPFRFVHLISCYAGDENIQGDSLPKAFTRDFESPLSAVIAGPQQKGIRFCYTHFFRLLAQWQNRNIPLYHLFQESDWDYRDTWPKEDYYAVTNGAYFFGSHSITPREIFS